MKIEFFNFKNWIDLIMKKFYINWVIFIICGGGIIVLIDDEIFIFLICGNLMFFLVEIVNMVWMCVFDSSDLISGN